MICRLTRPGRLESDDQLAFAVDEKIDGASEYRLELQKHAISGKLLAQAQAQAVRAGQEYVAAQISLNVDASNVQRLIYLQKFYQEEEEQALEAQGLFYDQLLTLRTSVIIQIRNLVWAYRFYTLEDSRVGLDPLKTIDEYRVDALTIQEELINAESRLAGDYQRKAFQSCNLSPFAYDEWQLSSIKYSSMMWVTPLRSI